MDLFFYFSFVVFIFFIMFSSLFFSRLTIIRLLQKGSQAAIVLISSLFFTLFFISAHHTYSLCEPYFFIEPLWQAKLFFLIMTTGSLFIILQLSLPSISKNIPSVNFQDIFILSEKPNIVFEKFKELFKNNHVEVLLHDYESLLFILEYIENQQPYVIEIKIEQSFFSRSLIHFLCYPGSKGIFIEKNSFQEVVNKFKKILILN